jgi:hypothetical protein
LVGADSYVRESGRQQGITRSAIRERILNGANNIRKDREPIAVGTG